MDVGMRGGRETKAKPPTWAAVASRLARQWLMRIDAGHMVEWRGE